MSDPNNNNVPIQSGPPAPLAQAAPTAGGVSYQPGLGGLGGQQRSGVMKPADGRPSAHFPFAGLSGMGLSTLPHLAGNPNGPSAASAPSASLGIGRQAPVPMMPGAAGAPAPSRVMSAMYPGFVQQAAAAAAAPSQYALQQMWAQSNSAAAAHVAAAAAAGGTTLAPGSAVGVPSNTPVYRAGGAIPLQAAIAPAPAGTRGGTAAQAPAQSAWRPAAGGPIAPHPQGLLAQALAPPPPAAASPAPAALAPAAAAVTTAAAAVAPVPAAPGGAVEGGSSAATAAASASQSQEQDKTGDANDGDAGGNDKDEDKDKDKEKMPPPKPKKRCVCVVVSSVVVRERGPRYTCRPDGVVC